MLIFLLESFSFGKTKLSHNCNLYTQNVLTAASSYVGDIESFKTSYTKKKGCIYTIKGSLGLAKFDQDAKLLMFKKKR